MADASGSSCIADINARVVTNVNTCHEHYQLELDVAHFPQSTPGQFVQILCVDDASDEAGFASIMPEQGWPRLKSAEWSGESAFLRRPFSIADRTSDKSGRTRLLVIHRAIGPGTRWLERRRAGDIVNMTGPLGRGFSLPESRRPVVLIGGGVGIPPMLYLARVLHERSHGSMLAIFGARSRDLFPVELACTPPGDADPISCLAFPHGGPVPALVTTDDGTLGIHGRVTDALSQWYARGGPASKDAFVVACGPEPMLQAVARLTRELGLACELCIERMMGCGLGTCLACATRVRDTSSDKGWRYALTCLEGPVFERERLFDYADVPRT
ncbi:MAG: dihydroorotate dehydrogenase electron transfer subunit [Planctomycetes bacterium]|nr:dihydroorotate dehydrogenase electron transfer subunit [Planctomycetota bacterium]